VPEEELRPEEYWVVMLVWMLLANDAASEQVGLLNWCSPEL
jgi:hypothetical protein